MTKKLTDAVAEFLVSKGLKHAFGISGGASLHIIHSLVEAGVNFHCLQKEDACGFAADAVARLGGFGCAVATSGPGASNLVTPIITSYYDSIPMLYLVGNVTTFRMARNFPDPKPRGYGFQELDIVDMVKGVTKYATEPMKSLDVIPELEKALTIAYEGRPGPVLVSIPDDVQYSKV